MLSSLNKDAIIIIHYVNMPMQNIVTLYVDIWTA